MKTYLDVKLHCSDGSDESLGFYLPDELQEFLAWINCFSKDKRFSFTVTTPTRDEILTNLIGTSKFPITKENFDENLVSGDTRT